MARVLDNGRLLKKTFEEITDAHENLRVYPSRSETHRAHGKIGDIRAPDLIAETMRMVLKRNK